MNYRVKTIMLGCLAILLTLQAFAADCAQLSPKPKIIFILADDLGWTDLGCYGSRYYETPHIDSMANEGMRLINGYSCGPNCAPTRAALMSGQYSPRTGIYTVGNIERFKWQSRPLRPVDNVISLPLDRFTIAQALKAAGYATGMFGKWHLGQNSEYHPSNRGFDEAIVSAGKHFNFRTDPEVEYPKGTYLADFLTDKAVDFIRRHQKEPFFLYLPHLAVHSPWQAKDKLIAKFQNKPAVGQQKDPTYAAMIASLDESVGRLLAVLGELKLSEKTLVIFSSDNGGRGGYQREGLTEFSVTDNAPLRGGKGMLYEGGIRVPYIFRWPGKISPGQICDTSINSVDLFPTLLELAGAKSPKSQNLDGVSYAALLVRDGRNLPARLPIYWHFPGYLGARPSAGTWRTTPVGVIRSGDWKLMEFFEDGRLELYNLREDIGENKELSASMPEKVKQLYTQLASWRKMIRAPMPIPHDCSSTPDSKPKEL